MINTNLIKIKQNPSPMQNNIIPYNTVKNTNQNIIQGQFNQVISSNINEINSEYNLN